MTIIFFMSQYVNSEKEPVIPCAHLLTAANSPVGPLKLSTQPCNNQRTSNKSIWNILYKIW